MVRGKKAASTGNSAGDVAPPKKMKGDWESSSLAERHLAGLRADDCLPPAEDGRLRCAENVVFPSPRTGERVVFVDFLTRGLSSRVVFVDFLTHVLWHRIFIVKKHTVAR